MGALRAPMIGREVELDRLLRARARRLGRRLEGGGHRGTTGQRQESADGRVPGRLADEGLAIARARGRRCFPRAGRRPGPGCARRTWSRTRSNVGSKIGSRSLAHGSSWRPSASLTGAAPVAPETADRAARFAAWIEALDALAGHGPVIWAIEDIHWASGDVLAFLAAAASAPTRHGRLIVATARPSVADRPDAAWSAWSSRPWPPAAAGRLVAALVGDALPPDLMAAIEERSDGNPLFIEELLRSWVAVGIAGVRGGWLAVDATAGRRRPALDGPGHLCRPAR